MLTVPEEAFCAAIARASDTPADRRAAYRAARLPGHEKGDASVSRRASALLTHGEVQTRVEECRAQAETVINSENVAVDKSRASVQRRASALEEKLIDSVERVLGALGTCEEQQLVGRNASGSARMISECRQTLELYRDKKVGINQATAAEMLKRVGELYKKAGVAG